MKLLLTGGTGYIGRHFLSNISNKIDIVYVLHRNKNPSFLKAFKTHQVEFIEQHELEKILINEHINAIVHFATFYGDDNKDDKKEIHQSNVVFPTNLLNLAIKNNVNCFINTDTFFAKKCYDLGYKSLYTESKREFENILKNKSNQINVVNMRLEHVYGPNDNPKKFVGWLSNQFKNNSIHDINLSECLQKRDFIYVLDVVSAYMAVVHNIDKLDNFSELQIGTGDAIKVRNFVEILKIEYEKKITKEKKVNFKPEFNRPGEIMHSVANIENNSLINWKPKYRLNEGIADLVCKELG